jgi:AraC-like DNA-binding protein
MQYSGKTDEYLQISTIDIHNCSLLKESQQSELSLLWFEEDGNELIIDAQSYEFKKNHIICLTEFHKLEVKLISKARLLRFNRSFYCVLKHDNEVSCKGVLYYGSSKLPILELKPIDIETLGTVWKMFIIEMNSKDNLQLEMLQMMLKRVIILCTRIYKNQHDFEKLNSKQVTLVREFNFLVEKFFRQKHTVAEYADLLNKSPKTLTNLFKKLANKSPLQFIQERKMLEARRLLRYTDRAVKDIAYELGYIDIQTFSRFFKRNQGLSPSKFRTIEKVK